MWSEILSCSPKKTSRLMQPRISGSSSKPTSPHYAWGISVYSLSTTSYHWTSLSKRFRHIFGGAGSRKHLWSCRVSCYKVGMLSHLAWKFSKCSSHMLLKRCIKAWEGASRRGKFSIPPLFSIEFRQVCIRSWPTNWSIVNPKINSTNGYLVEVGAEPPILWTFEQDLWKDS